MKILGDKLAFALERLWGWPTKLAKKAFPNFGNVHIVPPERIPPLHELTIWHWADPHGDRNWFLNWTGVDERDELWTFREWPDGDLGEWAVAGSKPDGKAGPAQSAGGGKAFDDYKRLILEIEGWVTNDTGLLVPGPNAWQVYDRQMDPRPAGTDVPGNRDCLTYIDYLATPITSYDGREIGPGLDYHAGVDCGIEEGKQWVNNWINLGWDAGKEVTPMNQPKWHISERCVNTIWALRTWTGSDGLKGACKDPIDCVKGLSKTGLRHVPKSGLGNLRGPGGY